MPSWWAVGRMLLILVVNWKNASYNSGQLFWGVVRVWARTQGSHDPLLPGAP
ncbi:unnamed protein product, partial [Staurois parvus]